MKVSKKYAKSVEMINQKSYDIANGFETLLSLPKAKFDVTVELHVRLGVDGKNADQQVRGVCILPHGTGKDLKVLVIAKGDKTLATLPTTPIISGVVTQTSKSSHPP